MMTFDEKLKARAGREDCPIPEDFDARMDALLETLPAQAAPQRRRPVRRMVIVGVAAAVCLAGAAAAAPAVLSMARGAVGYFSAKPDSPYASQLAAFEKYNAAVGVSQTVDGRTLTIDNLAVDDSYLHVFYTLSSETPIERHGDGSEPEAWLAQWSAPPFWAEIDGKPLNIEGTVKAEATFIDDRTIKGMRRMALDRNLPDQFDLLLYTGGSSSLADSEFQFRLAVDKSAVAVESRTVEPKTNFEIYGHKVRIERLSISPFGSTITLSEAAEDPWQAFLLRDDKGNYLPLTDRGNTGSNGFTRVSNTYEFLGADKSTQSVTLLPISYDGADAPAHLVKGSLDSLPLTDASADGLTLESLDVGAKKAVATFSVHGAVYTADAQFYLTGPDGGELKVTGDTYFDCAVDRETGLITATYYYPDAAAEELAQAEGIAFFQAAPLTLLEDQAITIDLQPAQ
ncbi:MAG: DUF5643 domain-containing protein [Eubacteriales bacterium]|nr:DUF5643 domain-containing protein [Eubacteriales bacterium]